MNKGILGNTANAAVEIGVSPSAFMRQLRPEYYSDSERQSVRRLSAATLEYHLETITARNQTHDFEIFCRKLCERAVCPNLRPQTGPDGGGDSKTDTETFPVADEIAGLTYVGEANSGRERWGFAFSAKATWADKVRKDVKGIVDTGRKFDRIICITSRFAKAKDRARIEDELTKKHGIPVTIHDRSWIVTEVVEKDRQDLAFNYLKIDEPTGQEIRLGPTDYSRKQQLEDIERALADPDSFIGMERQRVTEALVAAKLSRGLERPRVETDGRFDRAIRLAEAEGTYRQKLEARYHKIWTAFWWYDDFAYLNDHYDDFQSRVLTSDHAKHLELLGNLNQLLVNAVIHRHMTAEACRLDERTNALQKALEGIAHNPDRPNNSLEARTALIRIKLNDAAFTQDTGALASVWAELVDIIEKAEGLGEFDADGLATFIEVAGGIAGNDAGYNELVEKLAGFVSSRKSQAEGALILLRRAEKLDFDENLDMIRWLGKALFRLSKKEYAEHSIHAAQLLSLAYRSARLPWAARATCVFAVASMFAEAEGKSEAPVEIIPTMKIWAWIALELCHLPDFLFSIQLLNGCQLSLPLDEETKLRMREDIRELDTALGCFFLNRSDDELRELESVPDILEGLGLFMARTALLYVLGYKEVLRADGSLPADEADEKIEIILATLKGQPFAETVRKPMVLNELDQVFQTTVLGMKLSVLGESKETLQAAEVIVGSLEAFFATVLGSDIVPHARSFDVKIVHVDSGEPAIEIDDLNMSALVSWPRDLSVTRFDAQPDVCKLMVDLSAQILGATCLVGPGGMPIAERFILDDAVYHRITMISAAGNSYNRVVSKASLRLADWQDGVQTTYPLRVERPQLQAIHPTPRAPDRKADNSDSEDFSVRTHQDMTVSSVIDMHAWNRAGWRGCGYVQIAGDFPPVMAFLFDNAEAGRKIFERWRERFGDVDTDDEIVLSIIRDLPDENPLHYCVQIASKPPAMTEASANRMALIASKSMTMEPTSGANLKMFLEGFRRFGAFFLVPATGNDLSGFFTDLAITKLNLRVKAASEVGEDDIEDYALRIRGMRAAS